MAETEDKYPSRIEAPGKVLPRETPVVAPTAAKSGPLGADEVARFAADGYLMCERFFDADAVNVLSEEAERLRVSEEVRQSEVAVTEPVIGETRAIFGVQNFSELFGQLACESRILAMVQQLLGSAVYLHQTRLNLKPGLRGKESYWHSDFETWHAEDGMPEMRAIGCSISLTENYEYNGPILLIPGSHKYYCQCVGPTPDNPNQQSLKKQDFGIPSDEQLEWLVDQGGIAVPRGPVGSVLLLDCNIMHGSNSNITPYPRRNAFYVYNSMDNALTAPYAAEHERPWYLANRDAQALEPVDFSDAMEKAAAQPTT